MSVHPKSTPVPSVHQHRQHRRGLLFFSSSLNSLSFIISILITTYQSQQPSARASWRWWSAEPYWGQRVLSSALILWSILMIVINARLWNCCNCKASVGKMVKASAGLCVFLMIDSARRLGQSQGGSHLHCYRPSPVHYPELQHHRRHVQGHRDREGNPRPAHGLEGSLLQAGHHGSTNQLNTVETEKAGESCDVRTPREAAVTTISI